MSPVHQESVQQALSDHLLLPKPLPREKEEEFLAHANIKVPKQQEQAYRVLVTKHLDLFSKDKNDGFVQSF